MLVISFWLNHNDNYHPFLAVIFPFFSVHRKYEQPTKEGIGEDNIGNQMLRVRLSQTTV